MKTNSFCIFGKYLAYHLKSFLVPPVVRVPQVGNPWCRGSIFHFSTFCSAFLKIRQNFEITLKCVARASLVVLCVIFAISFVNSSVIKRVASGWEV